MAKNEIIHVPDSQMENFMRVASVPDERIMILDNNDFISKNGKTRRDNRRIFCWRGGSDQENKKKQACSGPNRWGGCSCYHVCSYKLSLTH